MGDFLEPYRLYLTPEQIARNGGVEAVKVEFPGTEIVVQGLIPTPPEPRIDG